ncbi:hypothetical protein PPRY_a3245 [Pseudoalteromonas prydzensis ACAM 620]|nr:hypothetical protein [Pseudoalteromonas prydzensis ACAM 620]
MLLSVERLLQVDSKVINAFRGLFGNEKLKKALNTQLV